MFSPMGYLIAADAGLMDFLAALKIVLVALMGVCAIAIIVLVLCQKGNSGGMNAISGITETYYSQNKGKTLEGRLKKWTVGIAIAMAIITITYFILITVVPGDL